MRPAAALERGVALPVAPGPLIPLLNAEGAPSHRGYLMPVVFLIANGDLQPVPFVFDEHPQGDDASIPALRP